MPHSGSSSHTLRRCRVHVAPDFSLMVVHHYDPHIAYCRIAGWSRTVYPSVLFRLDFWLCAAAHGALVALLRLDMLHLPNEVDGDGSGVAVLVPVELAAPLLALALLVTSVHAFESCRRHEEATTELAQVGEEVCNFVQELQATFGRIGEALPLRFAAAKYALASVYVFFFVITTGTVPYQGWSEIKAKGLLDEAEAQFMEMRYSGDRMALLHVWAMWAAHEAASVARASADSASGQFPPAASAGGLDRMARALRATQVRAKRYAGRIAMPTPYHMVQFTDSLVLLVLLVWAAVAAPLASISYYVASAAYAVLLVALLGLREAAGWLDDPLCAEASSTFPVADAVNATADVVSQLLIASPSCAFNPCSAWREIGHALFTQGQVERRTPPAVFPQKGTGPRRWPPRKAADFGEKLPAPLVDVGCCHVDVKGLPKGLSGPSGRPAAQRSAAEHLARLWPASGNANSEALSPATSGAVPTPYEQCLPGSFADGGLRTPVAGALFPSSVSNSSSKDTAKLSEAVSNESSIVGSVSGAAPYIGAGGVSKKIHGNSRRVGIGGSMTSSSGTPGGHSTAGTVGITGSPAKAPGATDASVAAKDQRTWWASPTEQLKPRGGASVCPDVARHKV